MLHRVTRGLRIPIAGEPVQRIEAAPAVSRVALVAHDYIGLRPTLRVAAGDAVQRGQLLFEDKKLPGVRFTAPGAGMVAAIHRGDRRALQSIVITLSDADRQGGGDQVRFRSFTGDPPAALGAERVRELLLESGLWTALRARPYSRVADPATRPRSIFVTATDTAPLAPDVELCVRGREDDVVHGLAALEQLTDGPVFVCTPEHAALALPSGGRVRQVRFTGPHPAGSAGYHMHVLDPAGRGRTVWHIGLQDVAAIGRLFGTGELQVERAIALAGPAVTRPRLIRTRLGAALDEITAGELAGGCVRVISGSVLSGRTAGGSRDGFLGRYHQQVSALPEGGRRELMGWALPGFDRFSVVPIFTSRLLPGRLLPFTTDTHGSARAIVPFGVYDTVMPFDVPVTYLLKALLTHDLERAEQLGCLELDEEDLALCTFVCPGKHEYGQYLRAVLTSIERDG